MSVLHEVKLMRCENVSTGNLSSDAQDASGFDFLLACQDDFGQNQVPRVAADFVMFNCINRVDESIAVAG